MATMIRIIMITFMIHLTDSFKILPSANGTDFLEGSAAALNCIFPNDTTFNRLQWENEKSGITLRCRNLTTCQQDSGFQVSRNGYNITLIIKHVKRNQNKWACSENLGNWIEFVTFNVIYPPPGKLVISMNNSEIFVGEKINVTCEWRGGYPSASVTLTCLSETKTNEDSVTITETVTREMSNYCRCEGEHVVKNAFSTYNISIQYIEESDDNLWLILAPTIVALIIIITGVIIYFKYRSYSMKKKVLKRNQISPKLEGERMKHIYDNSAMQQKDDESANNTYEDLDVQQTKDEPTKRIHENPAMKQKGDETKISIKENPAMQQKADEKSINENPEMQRKD